ncbi:MAG: amidohydrolase family protein [Planctomycetota bacterium]
MKGPRVPGKTPSAVDAAHCRVPAGTAIDIHAHPLCADPGTAAAMRRLAPQCGIGHVVLLSDVMAHSFYPRSAEIRRINDTTICTVRQDPGFFTGFCHLNPAHPRRFLRAEIDRCAAAGLRGIKLEVSVNARDRRLDPIMERAAALGWPVLHHAWYKTGGNLPDESTPAGIAHLAGRFPRAVIIMAHLSGCGVRGIHDIRPHPNISIDTSGG